MKRILNIIFFFIFIPFLTQAQEASQATFVFRLFKVLDAYSEKFITGAHVSIYEKDSTTLLVDSMKWRTGNPEEYYAEGVPKRDRYVFRIEKKGVSRDLAFRNREEQKKRWLHSITCSLYIPKHE